MLLNGKIYQIDPGQASSITVLGTLYGLAAIMTYEWGWQAGPPSPTAPLPFVRRVLDYAIASNIPANNIVMGLTNYGYNWSLPYEP